MPPPDDKAPAQPDPPKKRNGVPPKDSYVLSILSPYYMEVFPYSFQVAGTHSLEKADVPVTVSVTGVSTPQQVKTVEDGVWYASFTVAADGVYTATAQADDADPVATQFRVAGVPIIQIVNHGVFDPPPPIMGAGPTTKPEAGSKVVPAWGRYTGIAPDLRAWLTGTKVRTHYTVPRHDTRGRWDVDFSGIGSGVYRLVIALEEGSRRDTTSRLVHIRKPKK